MKSQLSFHMRKKQFIGLTVLGFLVLILETSFHFYKKRLVKSKNKQND